MKPIPFLTLAALLALPVQAQMTVALTPSTPAPAPLGTVVTWTATAANANPGTLWYRFRTRCVSPSLRTLAKHGTGPAQDATFSPAEFQTVVDYGPNSSLNWSTIAREGIFEIEVTVQNVSTGELAATSTLYVLTPLATGQSPVITPTSHPLVFIYSAPPCALGAMMTVSFETPGGTVQNTPSQPCLAGISMNFYLAGLRPNTTYSAYHTVVSAGSASAGPPLSFTTGAIGAIQQPTITGMTAPPFPAANGILLQSLLETNAIATDLSGNVVWYGPYGISFITRPETGGTFLGILEDGTQDQSHQFFEEFDLAWNPIAETNAARVNQELGAMGMHPINSFHHEARKLPGGGYLVLAGSERILTDVQGPGPVDVLGDTILILDANLNVTWAWDAFDHLDPARMAVLDETCTYPAGLQCSAFYQARTANDWLHGNSVQLAPDGNILYSTRHQDWLIKIDYENGSGTGAILWRLGNGGDFQIQSADPYPWFSHQHDANFESDGLSITVFDDGNTRQAADPAAHSRGQVVLLDEPNRTATLVLNADLGGYSYALGSAQLLPNGNYHFDSGAQFGSGPGKFYAQALELSPAGSLVYGMQLDTLVYRSFRMVDLYTAP